MFMQILRYIVHSLYSKELSVDCTQSGYKANKVNKIEYNYAIHLGCFGNARYEYTKCTKSKHILK